MEDEIAELEKEKIRLGRKQAKNPEKFSTENYQRLGEIEGEIKTKEWDWLKIQQKIEDLSK